jgi:hypothetical protein
MTAFRLVIEDEILALEAVLDGIGRIVEVEIGLQELRAHILTALWLVERDPVIDAAADALYQTAERITRGPLLDLGRPAHWRDLNAALARFQNLLLTAGPSEQARQAGLTTKET